MLILCKACVWILNNQTGKVLWSKVWLEFRFFLIFPFVFPGLIYDPDSQLTAEGQTSNCVTNTDAQNDT